MTAVVNCWHVPAGWESPLQTATLWWPFHDARFLLKRTASSHGELQPIGQLETVRTLAAISWGFFG